MDEQTATDEGGDVEQVDTAMDNGPGRAVARVGRNAPADAATFDPERMQAVIGRLVDENALQMAVAFGEAYDEACDKILGENDERDGYKVKSAWRKLGRFFGISVGAVEILRREWSDPVEQLGGRQHYSVDVQVIASAPWGQQMPGTGSCSTREKRFYFTGAECPECGGRMYDNRDLTGRPKWLKQKRERGELPDYTCRDKGCNGSMAADEVEGSPGEWKPNPVEWGKAEHNVLATATTRAINRAVSDLVAAGEVSYEEIEGTDAVPPPTDEAPPHEDTGEAGPGGESADEPVKQQADDWDTPCTDEQRETVRQLIEKHEDVLDEKQLRWGDRVVTGEINMSKAGLAQAITEMKNLVAERREEELAKKHNEAAERAQEKAAATTEPE